MSSRQRLLWPSRVRAGEEWRSIEGCSSKCDCIHTLLDGDHAKAVGRRGWVGCMLSSELRMIGDLQDDHLVKAMKIIVLTG